MLTRLVIRNLKRFSHAEVELSNRVLFVGPNNCGKTTALQALALWRLAVQRWMERYPDGNPPPQRPGVVIGRADLVATPVPRTMHLWRAATVGRYVTAEGKRSLDRTHIEIDVSGVTSDVAWSCAFEIDYANPESINCRPRRLTNPGEGGNRWSTVPAEAMAQRLAFLPPMSGLADREFRKDPGEVDFLIGQGRTAEVLRNLCHMVHARDDGGWDRVVEHLDRLFGARVEAPRLGARADLVVEYRERGTRLDISCAGRGMQQTLLLLTYMELNRGSVLLLDEPDAHLEVLRQGQIYDVLSEQAQRTRSQVIAATHSEKLLNEAAGRDLVVAFTGRPHRVDARKSRVLKALQSIGFEHYLQAEQRGWVLFLEGSTDLAFLRAFARKLGHPAAAALDAPYLLTVGNQPRKAEEHFHALRDAFPDLLGFGVFDRLDRDLPATGHANLHLRTWQVREVECLVARREVLLRWAGAGREDAPLLRVEAEQGMRGVLDELEAAAGVLGQPLWSEDRKASEETLPRVFQRYHERRGLPDQTRKADYHHLVGLLAPGEVHPQVREILDALAEVAARARPTLED